MDFLYSPICFSVDHLPSLPLHPHVSHTVPPPGVWPGPTTGIFGISHYRRPRPVALWRVWSDPREIQEELGGSRAPEHLEEQLSLKVRGERRKRVRVWVQVSAQTTVSTPISFGVRIRGVIPLLRSSSNSSNWPMKLRLGEMMGLLVLTNL